MSTQNSTKLHTDHILAHGYGRIPKSVMTDPSLSVESKGLLAYFYSVANQDGKSWVSRDTIVADLMITKDSYYKYRRELEEKNLISAVKENRRTITTVPVCDTEFGIIPRTVMTDSPIPIAVKALYAFLSVYSGNRGVAYPTNNLINTQLNISHVTTVKYLKALETHGLIVRSLERSSGRFEGARYELVGLSPEYRISDENSEPKYSSSDASDAPRYRKPDENSEPKYSSSDASDTPRYRKPDETALPQYELSDAKISDAKISDAKVSDTISHSIISHSIISHSSISQSSYQQVERETTDDGQDGQTERENDKLRSVPEKVFSVALEEMLTKQSTISKEKVSPQMAKEAVRKYAEHLGLTNQDDVNRIIQDIVLDKFLTICEDTDVDKPVQYFKAMIWQELKEGIFRNQMSDAKAIPRQDRAINSGLPNSVRKSK